MRKAQGKPFTIYSRNAKTEVLGTSFNVRAYPNEPKVEVQVVTGKVALSEKAGKTRTLYLTPGLKGELTDQNQLTQASFRDANLMAWKNGHLAFQGTPLAQVVTSLERYFDVKIRVENPQLLKCRYTGTYDQPDLQEILDILSVSVGLSYKKQNDQYTLLGQGCP